MNIHKNARLSLTRRIELVRMIVEQGQSRAETARAAGVSEPTPVNGWTLFGRGRAGLA